MSTLLLEGLLSIPGLRLQGSKSVARRVATFSFVHDQHAPSDIAKALSTQGLYCHWGDNYAVEVGKALGLDPVEGVLRLGLAHYNTEGEVYEALEIIRRVLA